MAAFILQQIVISLQVYALTQAEYANVIVSEPAKLKEEDFSSTVFKQAGTDSFLGARCKLRPIAVYTSGVDVGKFVIPKCIEVKKCSGCCGTDESLCCMPKKTSYLNVTVMLLSPHGMNSEMSTASFLQHDKCECRPRQKGRKCEGDPVAPLQL